jgi:hypothetical protein
MTDLAKGGTTNIGAADTRMTARFRSSTTSSVPPETMGSKGHAACTSAAETAGTTSLLVHSGLDVVGLYVSAVAIEHVRSRAPDWAVLTDHERPQICVTVMLVHLNSNDET